MFTTCGIMYRRSCCWSPARNFCDTLYHKLQTQSSAPEDGKYVELSAFTNRLLLLYLVGCLYY